MKNKASILLSALACSLILLLVGCTNVSAQTPAAGNLPAGTASVAQTAAPLSQTQNTPAAANYIGEAAAKAAALEHAGLSESDVVIAYVKLDWDNNRWEYEVEFYQGNVEYDYEIDAVTGAVLAFDAEAEHITLPSNAVPVTPAPAAPASTPAATAPGATAASAAYIGEAQAKQVALNHAGLTENDVVFVYVKLDWDDGRWEYEVEFYKDYTEYDYDIDAVTGAILSFDSDAEYITPGMIPGANTPGGYTAGSYITEADAKQIALAHAGQTENGAAALRVKFDFDDGRAEYEVEWYVGYVEYSVDVDATTGTVIGFDMDAD